MHIASDDRWSLLQAYPLKIVPKLAHEDKAADTLSKVGNACYLRTVLA